MFATYFDRPELVNEQLERYLAVDAEAIQARRAAGLPPDNRAVITYVPAESGGGGAHERATDLLDRWTRGPRPAAPRAYDFPDFARTSLPNGLTVLACHLPGPPAARGAALIRGERAAAPPASRPRSAARPCSRRAP